MKLKNKFILFVAILHLVALTLSFFIFADYKILFIASELLILVSIWFSWKLYRQLIQPLKSMMTGIDAIRDRDFTVKFLPTGNYEVDELIGVYNQMLDQLRTERTLQEEQHFFLDNLVTTSPTGIVILDFDDRVRQLNPRAQRMIGLSEEEVIGKRAVELPIELLRQAQALKHGESRIVKPDSIARYKISKAAFTDRGFQRTFVMIEELTSEILSAEKNVYGKVIRMMAHEVNNTIGPVNSILQSAIDAPALWSATHEPLRSALEVAADRNQNLNMFMRNFAELVKLPAPVRRELDLVTLVDSVVCLMGPTASRHNIRLVQEHSGAFFVNGDRALLEQALVNIVKNAVEAIGSDGVVTLRTDISKKELTVSDTGKGIAPVEAEQLFTPFFSTKRDGQGIGLMLVREILTGHGCVFSLRTVAHGETTFYITFDASFTS